MGVRSLSVAVVTVRLVATQVALVTKSDALGLLRTSYWALVHPCPKLAGGSQVRVRVPPPLGAGPAAAILTFWTGARASGALMLVLAVAELLARLGSVG